MTGSAKARWRWPKIWGFVPMLATAALEEEFSTWFSRAREMDSPDRSQRLIPKRKSWCKSGAECPNSQLAPFSSPLHHLQEAGTPIETQCKANDLCLERKTFT